MNKAWKCNQLNIKYLYVDSPVLDRAFHESLRLNIDAIMCRRALEPTMIGSKLFLPDTSLLMPSRQLHMNQIVWGNNYKTFNAERFVTNQILLKYYFYRFFVGEVN